MNRTQGCPHMGSVQQLSIAELHKLKKETQCTKCDTKGPNLWICLHKGCHQIGCSEQIQDHSTHHFQSCTSHCIHMNLSSQRIWCYLCEQEVFLPASLTAEFLSEERSFFERNGSAIDHYEDQNNNSSSDEYEYPAGFSGAATSGNERRQYGGLVGLKNLANTCYMNAALQALSNTPPLTGYFLDCGAIVETMGAGQQQRKPDLAKSYYRLVKEMWCRNRRSNGYVIPTGILHGIRIAHPMFRGYQQHDTQEFLRCFMDQLHEELKEVAPSPPSDIVLNEENEDQEGSEYSSPSPSPSEAEYETCDSGVSEQSHLSDLENFERPNSFRNSNKYSRSPSPNSFMNHQRNRQMPLQPQSSTSSAGSGQNSSSQQKDLPQKSHKSIISDVFDGKLLSSVQCLTCDRISTREETFQDLSLPIPGKDHLTVLHQSQGIFSSTLGSSFGPQLPQQLSNATCSDAVFQAAQDGWIWWFWNWFRSWFWGPAVTLHDCMAAFFSADELKNDNMYSCEKCNKLRNGIKYSRVLALPEMLCVHLKRFRHDLSYSSKISNPVHFPLSNLDMRPYLHKDCKSEVSTYDLTAVICHHGTVGGGHYTSYAKHDPSGKWFEYDDQLVTKVTPEVVQNCEPYVLFYRKSNVQMELLRAEAVDIVERNPRLGSDIRFFVSKNWFNRFNTFAEPGPIDNWALLCPHGGLPPCKAVHVKKLVMPIPQPLWDFLYEKFGGGPACNRLFECDTCRRAAESLSIRQRQELEMFTDLNEEFQIQDPVTIYAISMSWLRQWQLFARGLTTEEPGPINNISIAQPDSTQPIRSVKPGSDYAHFDVNMWRFFHGIYGGGPEIIVRGSPPEEIKHQKMPEKEKEAEKMETEDSGQGSSQQSTLTKPKQTVQKTIQQPEVVPSFVEPIKNGPKEEIVEILQDEKLEPSTSILGITSKLKQTMSIEDHNHEGGDNGNVDKEEREVENSEKDSNSRDSQKYSSIPSSHSGRKKIKYQPVTSNILDKKDKHRSMKSSGLFGAEGTFVTNASDTDSAIGSHLQNGDTLSESSSLNNGDEAMPLLNHSNHVSDEAVNQNSIGHHKSSHNNKKYNDQNRHSVAKSGPSRAKHRSKAGGGRRGNNHNSHHSEMHLSDSDK